MINIFVGLIEIIIGGINCDFIGALIGVAIGYIICKINGILIGKIDGVHEPGNYVIVGFTLMFGSMGIPIGFYIGYVISLIINIGVLLFIAYFVFGMETQIHKFIGKSGLDR